MSITKTQVRRFVVAGATLVAATGLTVTVAPSAQAAEPYVGVPKNYRPYGSPKTLHDYCTKSPDSFGILTWSGWKSVSWKGPCARHDMCYEAHSKKYKAYCDSRFLADLRTNCRWRFKSGSREEKACYSRANTYYQFVKKFGDG